MLRKLKQFFKRKRYTSPKQRENFESDINKEIAKKIAIIKKENETKDALIRELILDNLLLENQIELLP